MLQYALLESLEARQHFAASGRATTLDPNFLFTAAELLTNARDHLTFFQAVPATHDRTLLLSLRRTPGATDDYSGVGLLTIIAVNADVNLDKNYGDGGVALTGRLIERDAFFINKAGIAKLDDYDRLYVADGTRVMRFHTNGTTDLSFGQRGAAAYQPASRPVVLCDFIPTDNGVLVATTQTKSHIQRFAVQKIDRHVRTTWEATHDERLGGNSSSEYIAVSPQTAQFASNGGHIVLAAITTDYKRGYTTEPDGDPTVLIPILVARRQDLVVTGFDAAGHGAAIGHTKLRPAPEQNYTVSLGNGDERYPVVNSVFVSPTGRTVLAETDQELLRVNASTGAAEHFDYPAYPGDGRYVPYTYQLLRDGDLGAFNQGYTDVYVGNHPYVELSKFRFDGTPDPLFGNQGVIRTLPKDYPAGKEATPDQIFQGSSGRLYVLSNAIVIDDAAGGLSLRRV